MPHLQIKLEELQIIGTFKNLTLAQQATLSSYMLRRTYAPGQFIFFEGEESTSLWFILEGKVKIIKESANGRLQGLCLANRGKCFGSCPLFDAETNPAHAQALDEVTLAVLPRHAVQDLIYQDSELATALLQVYNDRLGLLAHLGECLGTWSVGRRINDCLISYAQSIENQATVLLTHEEIATLVGTAREVVTRHLADLEAVQLISTKPNHILLHDLEVLKERCIATNSSTEQE